MTYLQFHILLNLASVIAKHECNKHENASMTYLLAQQPVLQGHRG